MACQPTVNMKMKTKKCYTKNAMYKMMHPVQYRIYNQTIKKHINTCGTFIIKSEST